MVRERIARGQHLRYRAGGPTEGENPAADGSVAMDVMLAVILVAPLIAAAAYAHHRLPIHTRHAGWAWVTRLVLLGVGFALGALFAAGWGQQGYPEKWIAFLGGFGLAHLPAALILFMKRRRGEYT